jgi:uncharacterized protein involved in exopolysaccharide biosynthesis
MASGEDLGLRKLIGLIIIRQLLVDLMAAVHVSIVTTTLLIQPRYQADALLEGNQSQQHILGDQGSLLIVSRARSAKNFRSLVIVSQRKEISPH